MYKVTNKIKSMVKFWDGDTGKTVYVKPKETVLTTRPPKEGEVWKVEEATEEKPKKKIKEVDTNGSITS